MTHERLGSWLHPDAVARQRDLNFLPPVPMTTPSKERARFNSRIAPSTRFDCGGAPGCQWATVRMHVPAVFVLRGSAVP